MKTKKSKKSNIIKSSFISLISFVKEKYLLVILFFCGFITLSLINFAKVTISGTVNSYDISEFEIGQIADQTIEKDGEKIIKKGFAITVDSYEKLKEMSISPTYIDYRHFANDELFLLLIAILWILLNSFLPFRRKILFRESLIQVIFFLVIFSFTSFCNEFRQFSDPYFMCIIIPSTLFVLLITILYGNTTSVIFSLIISFGVLCASDFLLQPFLFTFAISLIASFTVRKIKKRIDLFFVAILLAFAQLVLIILFTVIFNDKFTNFPVLALGLIVNGFFSGILALGLLTPFEILLNTATDFRLMDLSDLNTPLMRKMLINASGTYNHSMMVAQLAENACREIGANPLIARVGAYYHDIGKIDYPEYFVENQKGENKHDSINPSLSVSVIKSHVKKGVEKAYQLHLPQVIIDIIAEHHGNSVIAFFYNEAKEKNPTLSPEDFAYQGLPPSTRESAVVMLADTVEAACRTLENPSVTRLEKFITQLVNAKVEHKQLNNCGLTFRDVSKIKEAFIQVLAGYYHSRIEYPDQNQKK